MADFHREGDVVGMRGPDPCLRARGGQHSTERIRIGGAGLGVRIEHHLLKPMRRVGCHRALLPGAEVGDRRLHTSRGVADAYRQFVAGVHQHHVAGDGWLRK